MAATTRPQTMERVVNSRIWGGFVPLLEPVMAVEVTTPDDYLGDVIGNLNARRGKIMSIEVRTGMQHQKREFKLICPEQFFGERSNGIGVKLRIGRSEVDQVIGVPEHRQQFTALNMIEKSADFLAG